MADFYLIQGETFEDHRGKLSFANSFDMSEVNRFYLLHHNDIKVVRAWQGHQNETKWFTCIHGSFIINIIKSESMTNPTGDEQVNIIKLDASECKILCLPGGYYSGIKAISEPSSLLIFSDFTLENSKKDDFRKEADFWTFVTDRK